MPLKILNYPVVEFDSYSYNEALLVMQAAIEASDGGSNYLKASLVWRRLKWIMHST